MKQSIEDVLFERIRRLEGHESSPSEKIIFEKLRDLSDRTDKLERWKFFVVGAAMACGFLFSATIGILGVFYGK